MAKIIIEIEDMPEGTAVNFKGDLPAVLISKMIQAAQMMTPPVRRH